MSARSDSRDLVTRAIRDVTSMLGELDETSWERVIAPVGWTCRFTTEHIGGDFLHYAGQVAARPTDHYVAFSFDQSRATTHAELVETIDMSGLLLAAAVQFAPLGSTAWHPQGLFPPEAFAAMGACEALVHGYDIALSLALAWRPDSELSGLVLDALFPDVPSTVRERNAPTDVRVWKTGRRSLPGVDDVRAWDYRAALPSWSG